ncbi:hypothetical protein MKK84_34855 [Methylobacterium sp. E-065]|nr:hypothetical protein [Methylobacterium sp. E-065]
MAIRLTVARSHAEGRIRPSRIPRDRTTREHDIGHTPLTRQGPYGTARAWRNHKDLQRFQPRRTDPSSALRSNAQRLVNLFLPGKSDRQLKLEYFKYLYSKEHISIY